MKSNLACLFILITFSVSHSKNVPFKEEEAIEEEERREICLGELGCFANTEPFDEPVWERLLCPLPDTREQIKTEFRFFAAGKSDVEVIKYNEFDSHINENSGYDATVKTVFITHGYLGGDAPWALEMKDALMQREKCNVFIVDWSDGDGPIYEQAVSNIRVVGAEIGLFIQKLEKLTNLDLQKVHLVGHSLGAHASGYAGKWFTEQTKRKIGRITGLDPAGPYFNGVSTLVRLDMGDAEFVDAIHTNWADTRFEGFGLFEPVAHFDFYPNGGEDQPGCPTAGEAQLSILGSAVQSLGSWWSSSDEEEAATTEDPTRGLSCSHGRAHELFTASITQKQCKFTADQCESWENYQANACADKEKYKTVQMGYNADKYKYLIQSGVHLNFFLKTSENFPYCLDAAKK